MFRKRNKSGPNADQRALQRQNLAKPLKNLFSAMAISILATALNSSAICAETSPLNDSQFRPLDVQKASIIRLLSYDKFLSRNRITSCSTCHHLDNGTGNGLSLGINEGDMEIGPKRNAGTGDDKIKKRIPRNATALWNLENKSINVIFQDARLEISAIYGNGFNSPAQE